MRVRGKKCCRGKSSAHEQETDFRPPLRLLPQLANLGRDVHLQLLDHLLHATFSRTEFSQGSTCWRSTWHHLCICATLCNILDFTIEFYNHRALQIGDQITALYHPPGRLHSCFMLIIHAIQHNVQADLTCTWHQTPKAQA